MALIEQLKLAIQRDKLTIDGLKNTIEKLHLRLNNLVVDGDKKAKLIESLQHRFKAQKKQHEEVNFFKTFYLVI